MTDLEAIKHFQDIQKKVKENLGRVRHKIAVISGKGGVGKTTFTVNLAVSLAMNGHEERVGILDADFHGPSVPKMLGLRGHKLEAIPAGLIVPVVGPLGIRVVSTDFILPDDDTPVIWRGPLKMNAIRDFLSEIAWGELDFLLIDLPPGTGDEPLSVAQLLPDIDGVVVLTIPSQVSQLVVRKSVSFARRLNMPIIGVVENMSGFICPNCGSKFDIFQSGGGRRIAEELKVPFLGSVPLDPRISEDSDNGKPFILEHSDSPAAKAFMDIVEKVEGFLGEGAQNVSLEGVEQVG
jgi:ATP-binding protein involved in chromosome partitioning